MSNEEDLLAAFQRVCKSPSFRRAPIRAALLKYLFSHRSDFSRPIDIWQDALERDDAIDEMNVRERCLDLRSALEDYFSTATTGWHIRLPDAVPRQGYRLQVSRLRNSAATTFAFWNAHLSSSADILIVYPEPMFFIKWREHTETRIRTVTYEDPGQALAVADEFYYDDVAYPYVESGHIEARDLIGGWFSEKALVKTQKAIVRRMSDEEITHSSLIAFGGRLSNRAIHEIFESSNSQRLALGLREPAYDRGDYMATVKNPSTEELRRLASLEPLTETVPRQGRVLFTSASHEMELLKMHQADEVILECYVEYFPKTGISMALLTRMMSPHSDLPVTIIESDSGRVVEYLARTFTDENLAEALMKQISWVLPFPTEFQILFMVRIDSRRSEHRFRRLEPLAWRSYDV